MQKFLPPNLNFIKNSHSLQKGKIVSKSPHAHTNIDIIQGKFKKGKFLKANLKNNDEF